MRAFVAVAGVLQNGKLVLCNVVIEIPESFLQFLIVCCGCSPCSDLQKYVMKQRKKSSTICLKPMKDVAKIHERCHGAVAYGSLQLLVIRRSAKICSKTMPTFNNNLSQFYKKGSRN